MTMMMTMVQAVVMMIPMVPDTLCSIDGGRIVGGMIGRGRGSSGSSSTCDKMVVGRNHQLNRRSNRNSFFSCDAILCRGGGHDDGNNKSGDKNNADNDQTRMMMMGTSTSQNTPSPPQQQQIQRLVQNIPSNLSATYRPISIPIRIFLWTLSLFIATATTTLSNSRSIFQQSCRMILELFRNNKLPNNNNSIIGWWLSLYILKIMIRIISFEWILRMLLSECYLFRPDRISLDIFRRLQQETKNVGQQQEQQKQQEGEEENEEEMMKLKKESKEYNINNQNMESNGYGTALILPSILSRYEDIRVDAILLNDDEDGDNNTDGIVDNDDDTNKIIVHHLHYSAPPLPPSPVSIPLQLEQERVFDNNDKETLPIHNKNNEQTTINNSDNNSNICNNNNNNNNSNNKHSYINNNNNHRYDVALAYHGFGASSLSYIPIIPSLSKRCKIQTFLVPDALGFGWTQPPPLSLSSSSLNNRNGSSGSGRKIGKFRMSSLREQWRRRRMKLFDPVNGSSSIGIELLRRCLLSQQQQQSQQQSQQEERMKNLEEKENYEDDDNEDQHQKTGDNKEKIVQDKKRRILILGHSMGSNAALETARRLSTPTSSSSSSSNNNNSISDNSSIDNNKIDQVDLVLISPAFFFPTVLTTKNDNNNDRVDTNKSHPKLSSSTHNRNVKHWRDTIYHVLRCNIIDPILSFALRRVVGTPGFWEKGLRTAVGNNGVIIIDNYDDFDGTNDDDDNDDDGAAVDDSNNNGKNGEEYMALRYRWPSLRKGWEIGLIDFARGIAFNGWGNQQQINKKRISGKTFVVTNNEKDNNMEESVGDNDNDGFDKDDDIRSGNDTNSNRKRDPINTLLSLSSMPLLSVRKNNIGRKTGGIRTNVLIVSGENDRVVPAKGIQRMLDNINNEDEGGQISHVILKDLGHLSFEEDPEQFVKLIEDWVSSID